MSALDWSSDPRYVQLAILEQLRLIVSELREMNQPRRDEEQREEKLRALSLTEQWVPYFDAGLDMRAFHSLTRSEISPDQARRMTDQQLMACRNLGKKTVAIIRHALG